MQEVLIYGALGFIAGAASMLGGLLWVISAEPTAKERWMMQRRRHADAPRYVRKT